MVVVLAGLAAVSCKGTLGDYDADGEIFMVAGLYRHCPAVSDKDAAPADG